MTGNYRKIATDFHQNDAIETARILVAFVMTITSWELAGCVPKEVAKVLVFYP
jgi:hypothetical protein